MSNLYTVRDQEVVWGLSSIMRVVNPTVLSKYKWVLDDLTPNPDEIPSSPDYTVGFNSN